MKRWLPLLLLLAAPAFAAQDFVAGSYRQILAAHVGQPVAIAFWSLECTHCPASLRTLAEFRRRHPELKLVAVSTDTDAPAPLLEKHLSELGLADIPSWRFADPLPERLRREVDARWWGELPRTDLVDARGGCAAKSGVIDGELLKRWWRAAP